MILCVLIFAVSASVTEKILKIPLFEVGELWINSVYKLNERLINYIWDIIDIYSPAFYVSLAVLTFAIYQLYGLVFRPIDRIRVLGDLGYLPEGKFTKKEIANAVKKRRALGDIPPIYPNGWYGIYESWRLKNGGSASVSVLGKSNTYFLYNKMHIHMYMTCY
jgi:cholesterol 7-dehydrogenase